MFKMYFEGNLKCRYKAHSKLPLALATYGRFLASLVQWAAVTIVCLETSIPPHQNSLRLLPCKKMATIHGCSPSKVVLPPTIRP